MPIDYLAMRQLRVAKNMTLESLATEIGVHPSYLSKIERGEAVPSTIVQLQLEGILGYVPSSKVSYETSRTEDSGDSETKGIDPRNMLNDLTGKEWIRETKTVWRQKGLGAKHPHTKYEKLHPAPFSFQDVARLIRFFTKRGMLVLDPFCGVGSTLKAAALEERRGLGVELSPKWAELAKRRLMEEVPDASNQQIWCMDIRLALQQIADNSIDFIVTSPPYWNILNKKPDHKTKAVRTRNGLAQSYSDDPNDLGNIADYDTFLNTLAEIFEDMAGKLIPGRYCTVIVSDFKHRERYYPFHSDLYSRIDGRKLALQGIAILTQDHKSLYPYGYPYAYVPNIHHQYILIFRRPGKPQASSRRLAEVSSPYIVKAKARAGDDLDAAIGHLRQLPYKQGSMASRHWGHRRHSICSFPSKMKPALASVLVSLFSTRESVILDPFSGSGTIPFEAALQGRAAIGVDLSPLAFVITAAKIMPPTPQAVEDLLDELEQTIAIQRDDASLNQMEPEIQTFYHEDTAREILVAREFLRESSDGLAPNDAALFVTACLAHILHGNRPYALSRRSHNIIPIPPKGPVIYKSLITSLRDKCSRMLSFPLPPGFARGQAIESAAHTLPLDDRCIDAVITSPSFLGTTDFLRQNRLRNWLVGWDYQTQAAKKEQFLEHQTGVEGYRPILHELHRVLRPGSLAVFHVGIVKSVSMADLLAPLFAEAGFREAGRVWEDTSNLESHGRTDRGGTHTHGFVILTRT